MNAWPPIRRHDARLLAATILIAAAGSPLALALPQADAPRTADPDPVPTPAAAPASPSAAAPAPAPRPRDERGRRIQPDEPTVLAFKNVSVDQVIPFIVEATGKTVLPMADVQARRITILNDQPMKRSKALDLVFFALGQNGIAVVETQEMVTLSDLADVHRTPVPVLGPDVALRDREDIGTIVEKVFSIKNGSAQNIGEVIKDTLPDYAKMLVDKDSNQIAIMGNIGFLQRLESLITKLDQQNYKSLSTETFRLRYADAEQVADSIRQLYSDTAPRTGGGGGGGGGNPIQQFFQQQQRGGQGGQGGQGGGRPGAQGQRPGQQGGNTSNTSANLRVTASTQQNAVTVLAEPEILAQIRKQIEESWDVALPIDQVVPRIYNLKNSDPIKVRTALESLFGQGTPTTPGQGGGGGGGTSGTSKGVGRLAGHYSFEALPESSRLVVVSKTPDDLDVIDKIIEGLDQPQSAGLPQIIELKHASAEELAEQLNAMLAQEGTLAQIIRSQTGLTTASSSASPFATQPTDTTQQNQQNQQATSNANMQFWWQRARPPTTTSGSGNLVGKIRIVPVWRQNALMIMTPPEYTNSLVTLIEQLDHPGRQVLIAAIVAEISSDNSRALGIRWSNAAISPTNAENTVSIGPSGTNTQPFTGTKNDLIASLFDTSVLNIGVNLHVLLQALAQKTDIKILSEPRIFTSDNQEAIFFDGQDIPFITQSQPNTQGNIVQSFDYRAVGIQLRVRPRITVTRKVDLKIDLELSSIQPTQTLFGGFIVDRRQTTTQLIVQDGQTVVVSGILRSEDSDIKRKIPLLGDIPLIGLLFRSVEKSKTDKELVAFITPIVVENDQDSDRLNEAPRKRLEELEKQLKPPTIGPGVVEPPSKGPNG